MGSAARRLIEAFEALPLEEQREVRAGILRKDIELPYPRLEDDELVAMAEDVFAMYDSEKPQEPNPRLENL